MKPDPHKISSRVDASPEELRTRYNTGALEWNAGLRPDMKCDILAPAGNFRGGILFEPKVRESDAVIVYFHGGGFVSGSPETHTALTSCLADLCGMRVLSARYGLTPEHGFPVQKHDAVAAIEVAATQICAPGAPLFLAGDSAGACIALWGYQGSAPSISERIAGAVLLYSALGLTRSTSIDQFEAPGDRSVSEGLEIMYGRLGSLETLTDSPAFNLLHAENWIDLECYLLVAGQDPLADDSRQLHDKMQSEGGSSTLALIPDAEHGFMKRAYTDPVAQQALKNIAVWIRQR